MLPDGRTSGRFKEYHQSPDVCLIKRWVGIDDA